MKFKCMKMKVEHVYILQLSIAFAIFMSKHEVNLVKY